MDLHAVQGQIAAQPGLDNVIQGCPLLMVLKKQIYPSTGQADYEIPGRTIRNQNFGHPTTVAATIIRPGLQTHPELQIRIAYLVPASFCPRTFCP
jgi:hypothetical protein